MTRAADLGAGLRAITHVDEAAGLDRLDLELGDTFTGVRFDRTPGRTHSCIGYMRWRIVVDVSFQPAALLVALDQAARDQGVDPNRWRGALVAALREWHGGLEWCAVDGTVPLDRVVLAAVGAVTHPLLDAVYALGHRPLRETPRWALPVLHRTTPLDAARALTPRANRRVARSLATSLVRRPVHETPDFVPLALATAAAGLVTVDELANVLEVNRPRTGDAARTADDVANREARGEAAPTDDPETPTVDDVELVRDLLTMWPAERRGALLLDAVRQPSFRDVVTVFTHLRWVRDRVERPLPMRIADLRTVCARHVPVLADTADPPRTAGAGPADAHAAPPRRRQPRPAPDAAAAAATAPAAANVPQGALMWRVPAALRRIHRHTRCGIIFDVATSAAELRRWGTVLDNCVAAYAPLAHRGEAWIIGMWLDGVLVGCIEVDPQLRRIVQIEGPSNRPLHRPVERIAFEALHDCGVTRAA